MGTSGNGGDSTTDAGHWKEDAYVPLGKSIPWRRFRFTRSEYLSQIRGTDVGKYHFYMYDARVLTFIEARVNCFRGEGGNQAGSTRYAYH